MAKTIEKVNDGSGHIGEGYNKIETWNADTITEMAKLYKRILELIGEDPTREGLLKTPERVAKAMNYLTVGYNLNPHEILSSAKFTEEYKQMVIRKTGGLFMLAIRLMQLFSEVKDDYTKLTAVLGLYFQIRDDYLNLCSKEYSDNKSYCEDLTEGKFSFPIIHAVQNEKDDRQVLRKCGG